MVHIKAVQTGQERRLFRCLLECPALAQGHVDVVEENNAGAVKPEQLMGIAVVPGGLESLGADVSPTQAIAVALAAQPAAGHRLAVARLAQQQHAAPLPDTELFQPLATVPQKADGVVP